MNIKNKFGRAAAIAAIGLILAFSVAATAPSASASAEGWQTWKSHSVSVSVGGVSTNVLVPSGILYGNIQGKGLNWTQAGGYWVLLASGDICNWHMSIQFYQGARSDNNMFPIDQPNQPNCARQGGFKVENDLGYTTSEGSVCIRLYRDFGNELLASVCHAIHK